MRVTVVRCNCGSSMPHRKFKKDDGRLSESFYSVRNGKEALEYGLARGLVVQTADEKAATLQELESCGLPAESPEESVGPSAEQARNELLADVAERMRKLPLDRRIPAILVGMRRGDISASEGARILILSVAMEDR